MKILLVLLCAILGTSLLFVVKHEHFKVLVPEFYKLIDAQIPSDIDTSKMSEVPNSMVATFVFGDKASFNLSVDMISRFQIMQHSEYESYVLLMTRFGGVSLQSLKDGTEVGFLNDVDKNFVNVIATCTNKKLIPVKSARDFVIIHSQVDYDTFVLNAYSAIDLISIDKNVMRVVLEGGYLAYHKESRVAVFASPFVLAMKNDLFEKFEHEDKRSEFVMQNVEYLSNVYKVPKAFLVKANVNIDNIGIWDVVRINSFGKYYVMSKSEDTLTLIEAIPIEGIASIVKNKLVVVKQELKLYVGDLVYLKTSGCYGEVVDLGEGGVTFVLLISCISDDKNGYFFEEDYECYMRPNVYNEDVCDTQMTRKCVYDGECPYFMSNETSLRGGCKNGTCEMPLGVTNVSHTEANPKDTPLCSGCHDGTGDCCDERNLYAFVS